MKNFLNYLNTISPISEETKEVLGKIFTKKTFSKKEQYLRFGQVPKKITFLSSGAVRFFSVLENGKETNRKIIFKKGFILPLPALTTKTPSLYSIECLKDSVLIEANYEKFIKAVEKFKDLNTLHRINLQNLYVDEERRSFCLISLSATEYYELLLEKNQSFEKEISKKDLSSYLGISPVQLSRIRKKRK